VCVVQHLVTFYCDRLKDKVSVIPQVLLGLQVMVSGDFTTACCAVKCVTLLFTCYRCFHSQFVDLLCNDLIYSLQHVTCLTLQISYQPLTRDQVIQISQAIFKELYVQVGTTMVTVVVVTMMII